MQGNRRPTGLCVPKASENAARRKGATAWRAPLEALSSDWLDAAVPVAGQDLCANGSAEAPSCSDAGVPSAHQFSRSGQTLVSRGTSGRLPQPRRVQPLQEGRGIAISLVADDPPGLQTPRSHDALHQLRCQLVLSLCRESHRESGSPATWVGNPHQTRTQAGTDAGQVRSRPCGWHSLRRRPPGSYLISQCSHTTEQRRLQNAARVWESRSHQR